MLTIAVMHNVPKRKLNEEEKFEHENIRFIEYLISLGADVNAKDKVLLYISIKYHMISLK